MKRYVLVMAVVLALFANTGYGEDVDEFAHINGLINSVIEGGQADSIAESVIPGLFEVVVGADVFYITKDGRYMLQGDLIDWQQRVNQTEEARSSGRKKIIDKIDENSMIVFSPENPKYTVTVFTDIDCGYCRKLHAEMEQYNKQGITIRYVAFPRSGLNTPSYFKAVAAWCSKDPQVALTASKAGQRVEKEIEDCKDPVAEHLRVAQTLNLRGTPTLFLEDGRMLPGYVPADQLVSVINEK